MNKYNKTFFSLLVVMLIHGTLKADIIDVNVESTAFGSFWDLTNEFGLDPVNFESPQIADFGSHAWRRSCIHAAVTRSVRQY